MKHHIEKTLLVVFALLLSAYSCSDDKDETYSLQVNKNMVVDISHKGTSGTFDILSNTNWTISDIPDWISLSKTSGSDNARISYTIAPYTTSDEVRTATLVIKSPNIAEAHQIVFSQYSPNTYYLTTDAKESYIIPYTGETFSINVKSNTTWELQTEANKWMTVSPKNGKGDTTITIKVDELNEAALESRFTRIYFTGKGVNKPADTLTVIQTPKITPTFKVDKDSITDIKPIKTFVRFSIHSNISKIWSITDIPDWISLSRKNGSSNSEIVAIISPLPEDIKRRSATLTITLNNYMPETKTQITLTQVYKENLYNKIPDKNFKNEVIRILEYKGIYQRDNFFTKDDLEKITSLTLENVSSIEGLEFFSNLENLTLSSVNIPSVFIKRGPNYIETLSMINSNIKNLEVDNSTYIEKITYTNEQESSLTIDSETLKSFDIINCPSGISLNIEKASNLRQLNCYNNRFKELNVKNNSLETIDCSGNDLTELTIDNPNLKTLLYSYNNKLTNLDLSKAENLKTLRCKSNNDLVSLTLDNPKLESIDCLNNTELKVLNLDKSPTLNTLICSKNPNLTDLIVNSNNLNEIECDSNKLTNLDVSKAPNLKTLLCHDNKLTTLDISKNIMLTTLYAHDNPLHTLYVWWEGGRDNFPSDLYSLYIPYGVTFVKK